MTEKPMSEPKVIAIRQRPWYEWLGWALWLALLFFIVQNAMASGAEQEPRAAMILWVSAGVVLLAGVVVGFVRRNQ